MCRSSRAAHVVPFVRLCLGVCSPRGAAPPKSSEFRERKGRSAAMTLPAHERHSNGSAQGILCVEVDEGVAPGRPEVRSGGFGAGSGRSRFGVWRELVLPARLFCSEADVGVPELVCPSSARPAPEPAAPAPLMRRACAGTVTAADLPPALPKFVRCRPNAAQVDEAWPPISWAKVGRSRPMCSTVGQIWPKPTSFGRNVRGNLGGRVAGRNWPNAGRNVAESADFGQFGPNSAKHGQMWPNLTELGPNIGRPCRKLADVGPNLAQIWPDTIAPKSIELARITGNAKADRPR